MKRGSSMNKKLQEEQQAIGAIYKQYIDTFQDNSEIPRKTFVKSDTLYGENSGQSYEKGQLYNPKPIIKLKKESTERPKSPTHYSSLKRSKKKSNLKALGDELKMLQHERQIKEIKLVLPKIETPSVVVCHESDYTNSTNLFVSNLNPNITEDDLIRLFGVYGPLASVKIMWPRHELSYKTANCGFVAFMSRADAERALEGLKNHEDMRINWGKSVKIPTHPVHIPPELYKLYSPPPPSGLPFNAQIGATKPGSDVDLSKATIKVTIPFDRNLLMIIHRMIEFVIREGPEFEAMIMNIEAGNPDFCFLTDFKNPAHTYYRWKLCSILNGDPKNSWSMKPFRLYKNGSIWLPPTAPNYKDGMPKELIISKKEAKLADAQADQLISLIKNMTTGRKSIAQIMAFCLNHASCIDELLDIVIDSLKNPETHPVKKVARLYLLSDVLYNCMKKKIPSERFTEANFPDCLEIFKQFNSLYSKFSHREDKDCLRIKIFMLLRSWSFYGFYDVKFITKLENIFLHGNEAGEDDDNSLNDEPLDGANLVKRSLRNVTPECTIVKKTEGNKFFDIFTY